MKLYDLIKQILSESELLRWSDKQLMWEVWKRQGLINKGEMVYKSITEMDFFTRAEEPETIRRTRQKVMEDHPELGRTNATKKERTKGMFVYHEKLPVFDNVNNTVRFK